MVSPPRWKLCSKTYSGQIMGSEFRIGSSQETKYDVACSLLQHTQNLVQVEQILHFCGYIIANFLQLHNCHFLFKHLLVTQSKMRGQTKKEKKIQTLPITTKGQFISKGHFGFFNSPKKRTKNFCPSRLGQKLKISRFFGRMEDTKISF